jgi:hypothetical protein
MARRTIGKPRFYCDVFSYLKSIGMYYGTSSKGLISVNNQEKPYTMNPYQPNDFELDSGDHKASFRFWLDQEPLDDSNNITSIDQDELGKLLAYHNPVGTEGEHHSSGWYAGILGHNLVSSGVEAVFQRFYGMGEDSNGDPALQFSNQTHFREIINFEAATLIESAGEAGKPKYDGFSLWEITSKNSGKNRFSVGEFKFENNDATQYVNWTNGDSIKIGAVTAGIFFEPEYAFELQASVSNNFEGIKTQTTIGGHSITNINYLGVPNWGDQPAWTLQKTDGRDYRPVANRARRQWNVGLSFIADDNMFDKAGNANKFYNDSFTADTEDAYSVNNFDTSLSSFFKLTHMGKLPFIFCPDSQPLDDSGNIDKDKLEFAICRITNKPSFKQVANNLFSTSLVLTETW